MSFCPRPIVETMLLCTNVWRMTINIISIAVNLRRLMWKGQSVRLSSSHKNHVDLIQLSMRVAGDTLQPAVFPVLHVNYRYNWLLRKSQICGLLWIGCLLLLHNDFCAFFFAIGFLHLFVVNNVWIRYTCFTSHCILYDGQYDCLISQALPETNNHCIHTGKVSFCSCR